MKKIGMVSFSEENAMNDNKEKMFFMAVNKKKNSVQFVDAKPQGSVCKSCVPFREDGCRNFLPAGGNYNGTTLNYRSAGSFRCCYWSSNYNASNANNGLSLGYGSSGVDYLDDDGNGNSNRNNGFSVRAVSESAEEDYPTIKDSPASAPLRPSSYKVTKEQLLVDLYEAYLGAREQKRRKQYQQRFEYNLDENLVALRDEIYYRTYKPGISTCFMVHEPKHREVFAAAFRDRVVHHLIYNYTYNLFVRTFIEDSYSCIIDRGTSYGVERLKRHILSVSENYQKPCYVLKFDIKGYFMHINRALLLKQCRQTLDKMRNRMSDEKGKKWHEKLDYEMLDFLISIIVMNNPTSDCNKIGQEYEWAYLPKSKSLFNSPMGCGMPIGNLTSQLFSNVYMNSFDQYMKRTLKQRCYGRYVDDGYLVASSRMELKRILPLMDEFLQNKLGLKLQANKTMICDARYGVLFVGIFLKPYRQYISRFTVRRIRRTLNRLIGNAKNASVVRDSMNSLLGVLSHYASYRLRLREVCLHPSLFRFGCYDDNCLHFIPRKDFS